MRILGYSTEEVDTVWKLLAAILHLVYIQYNVDNTSVTVLFS